MFSSYLKITLRVLARRKFFTFVSLFGISITLAVLLLVAAQIDHSLVPRTPEGSFDRVLTLRRVHVWGEKTDISSSAGYRLIDRYCRGMEHVQAVAVKEMGETVTSFVGGQKISSDLCYVDAAYWQVLDFEFLDGHAFDAADDEAGRRVVVIDERTRRRFFGDEPAVGRPLTLGTRTFQVVGVVPTVPIYLEMARANIWAPLSSIPRVDWRESLFAGFTAAFLVDDPANFDAVKAEFRERLQRVEYPDPDRYDNIEAQLLTRLERVIQSMAASDQDQPVPVARVLAILAGLAVLFMSLPAINLININLSRIWDRSTEIGVRKAFGASSGDLVGQFVVENVLLSVLGGLLGLAVAGAVLAAMPGMMPEHVVVEMSLNWRLFVWALLLAVFFGLMSGVWPAWRMAMQHPVDALRGGLR